MNCFVHIVSRNLVKYTCKLNNKGKYADIKKDLVMIDNLAYIEDFFRVLDLFHIKYGNKEEFLDIFEKEYLNDNKGHWLVSLVNHYGILRSNNGNESYN